MRVFIKDDKETYETPYDWYCGAFAVLTGIFVWDARNPGAAMALRFGRRSRAEPTLWRQRRVIELDRV
jgi:hypothetical protein